MLKYFFKSKSDNKNLVCVQFSQEGLSVVVAKINPSLKILKCEYFSGNLEEQQQSLSAFVLTNQLQNADCYGVLALEDYRLILIEKPKVAEDEIGESVKWLIKDLIDFSVEEAVVDFFPAPTRVGQVAKIYVVVTRRQWINLFDSMINQASLKLKSIDIATLALRNILSSLHIVGNSAVFLMQNKEQYYILIVKDQLIYLERKLELSVQNQFFNELVTELRLSIDFYQNHDKTIPIKIFLDPLLGKKQTLVNLIEQTLNLQVEVLDIPELLHEGSIDDKIGCLGVIGEALGLEARVENNWNKV